MKKIDWLGLGFVVLATLGLLNTESSTSSNNIARADTSSSAKNTAKPVEESMHEFMEYVFQPTYKRLKQSMATEPADRSTWKAIKSDSLILAESGNLLLLRKPEQQADVWNQHSVEVRELGGKLYRAAAKKDYKTARHNYTAMLTRCNSCHKAFAKGKHQLKP